MRRNKWHALGFAVGVFAVVLYEEIGKMQPWLRAIKEIRGLPTSCKCD